MIFFQLTYENKPKPKNKGTSIKQTQTPPQKTGMMDIRSVPSKLRTAKNWEETETALCENVLKLDENTGIERVIQFENSNAPAQAKMETLEWLLKVLMKSEGRGELLEKTWQAFCYQASYVMSENPARSRFVEQKMLNWIARVWKRNGNEMTATKTEHLLKSAGDIFENKQITEKLAQTARQAMTPKGMQVPTGNQLELHLSKVRALDNLAGYDLSKSYSEHRERSRILKDLEDYLHTEEGKESCCEYVKERIEALYAQWEIYRPYHLSALERDRIKDNLKGITINRDWIGLTGWSVNGKIGLHGGGDVDHELLHTISGGLYRLQGDYLGLFLFYSTIEKTASLPAALEEGVTSLLSDRSYSELVDAINKKMMGLEPAQRRIMADKLMRTYMNFSNNEEIDDAEAFVKKAIEEKEYMEKKWK